MPGVCRHSGQNSGAGQLRREGLRRLLVEGLWLRSGLFQHADRLSEIAEIFKNIAVLER